jgi:hypothetical protein
LLQGGVVGGGVVIDSIHLGAASPVP